MIIFFRDKNNSLFFILYYESFLLIFFPFTCLEGNKTVFAFSHVDFEILLDFLDVIGKKKEKEKKTLEKRGCEIMLSSHFIIGIGGHASAFITFIFSNTTPPLLEEILQKIQSMTLEE